MSDDIQHRTAAITVRAIELALREGCFEASDVSRGLDEPPSQSTVTRVLRQLEADDWLQRTAEESSLWRAGPTARLLGDMGERAREAAERPAVQPGRKHYGQNWEAQRQKALKRDDYSCQGCGISSSDAKRSLHVHHIKPIREFENVELANRPSNLVTLCDSCHRQWEGIPLRPQLSDPEESNRSVSVGVENDE